MAIAEKLAYLEDTKKAIKDAIIEKGTDVPEGTTFRAYADKVREISGGGGDNTLLLSIVERTITDLNSDLFTTVGDGAFFYCNDLTTVSLPEVISVGADSFDSCIALTNVSLPRATSIGDGCFTSCESLVTISLPEATYIGYGAFNYSPALTDVSLPKATVLGAYCFDEDSSLTNVFLPEVIDAQDGCFSNCTSLTELSLPKVTALTHRCFQGCSALTKLELSGSTFCRLGGDPKIPAGCKIYVPANLIDQYKAHYIWSKYASQFVAIV